MWTQRGDRAPPLLEHPGQGWGVEKVDQRLSLPPQQVAGTQIVFLELEGLQGGVGPGHWAIPGSGGLVRACKLFPAEVAGSAPRHFAPLGCSFHPVEGWRSLGSGDASRRR